MPKILSHYAAGASLYTLDHFKQLIQSGGISNSGNHIFCRKSNLSCFQMFSKHTIMDLGKICVDTIKLCHLFMIYPGLPLVLQFYMAMKMLFPIVWYVDELKELKTKMSEM